MNNMIITQWLHPKHPRRHQSDLQNCLGDLTKEGPRPCCGPWRLHLPEPERALAKTVTQSADEHAFLRVEEGVDDGDVLPPHEAGGVGYSVPWYMIDGSWVRYFVIGGMPGRAEAGGRSCQYLFRENEMNEEHQLCGF